MDNQKRFNRTTSGWSYPTPILKKDFIRAEVIKFEISLLTDPEAKCREAGKLNVEGKAYIVQDGDITHF